MLVVLSRIDLYFRRRREGLYEAEDTAESPLHRESVSLVPGTLRRT